MLVRTKFVVEKEDVGPTRLIVTNRPHREGRLGFRWDGKWYGPGDVLPEDNLPLKKRMTLLNVDWVREEPIPTVKRKSTKRRSTKRKKQLKRVA
jgi:hypothetical protein